MTHKPQIARLYGQPPVVAYAPSVPTHTVAMPVGAGHRACPYSIPDCKAWAMHDTIPPRCASHIPGKAGAPEGNRNALLHGFYTGTFHPDDIAALDEQAIDSSLDGEILIVRTALRRLQQMIVGGTTPAPNPRRLEAADYARFLGLTFQGANTLARLLRIRWELPDNPWDRLINEALDNLSEEWGVEL